MVEIKRDPENETNAAFRQFEKWAAGACLDQSLHKAIGVILATRDRYKATIEIQAAQIKDLRVDLDRSHAAPRIALALEAVLWLGGEITIADAAKAFNVDEATVMEARHFSDLDILGTTIRHGGA